jgi:Tfp pilus assembly protein PilF
MIDAEPDPSLCEAALREEARLLGDSAVALTELAIARRSSELDTEKLERAADILEALEFLSGAYEALFLVATAALNRGHNVVAERHYQRALKLAQRGSFLNGVLLARVGLFQSASVADSRDDVRSHCDALVRDLRSELALGSSGLNCAAAQQIVGDWGGALKTAKRCQQFFARQGLSGFESQALSIIGTCEAQQGRWRKARAAWTRAVELDEQRHAFIQACERRGLVVQALVMDDMMSLGQVRDVTAEKAHVLLHKADEGIRGCGDVPEAVQARARIRSIHAQLCVMTKRHVESLRHLSAARVSFESLGMQLDVAMVDAFTGLSLMEVGKAATPDILEEAVMTLQRAQQFFSSPAHPGIRWKLSYYLATAAIHISNAAGEPPTKMKWRDLAAGWVRSAEQDLSLLDEGGEPVVQGLALVSDFSPGLKPTALEALQRALGFKGRGVAKERERRSEKALVPGDGLVH